jgi:SAM-dependent methyltransferase
MTHEIRGFDNPHELERIYARRFEGATLYREKVWKVLLKHFFSRYTSSARSVLDLGCGYGEFINNVEVDERYAMDMNPHTRRVLEPGVQFLEQDCSRTWPLPAESLDLIFTSNFFEHLPGKRALASTLSEAFRCLRPGGRLIALGPNCKFTGGAYWDFFDHHIPLTELSLKEIFEITGFRVEAVIDRFLPYTMVNARQYPMWAVSLYLKLPLVWRFAGRQFLLIGAKP